MKILVIHGDNWHQPIVSQKGLEAINNPLYNLTWINNIRYYSLDQLCAYEIVILIKSNDLSETDQKGWMKESTETVIKEYIQIGHGFVAIHSGMAEYDNNHLFRSILGGIFDHHPEQCEVTIIPKEGHPLNQGIESFTVKDEHYFITIEDHTIDVFLSAKSEHGVQPAGWRRMEGKGRVAIIAPGHNLGVWMHPSYKALLQNVINWCSEVT